MDRGWVGGVWPISSFYQIFGFVFNLTRTLTKTFMMIANRNFRLQMTENIYYLGISQIDGNDISILF